MKLTSILNSLSSARLESSTTDASVYNRFVVPISIDQLDLTAISHSIALVGSRGCGKTTYIKYFSHWTRFDKSRNDVGEYDLRCVVLYWKPDIIYCRALNEKWMGRSFYDFFMAHASLELIEELVRFIDNVVFHFPEIDDCLSSGGAFFQAFSQISGEKVVNTDEAIKWLARQRYDISTRVNSVNTAGMISIDVQSALRYLIDSIAQDVDLLASTCFKIFIDEFELITESQQNVVNDLRKQSTARLSWNVAHKAGANPSVKTTTEQWLQKPDDFREMNLDSLIGNRFELYGSEIFLLSLQNAGLTSEYDEINPSFLGSRENIPRRTSVDHEQEVMRRVKEILPTPSIRELSEIALLDKSVEKQVRDMWKRLGITDKTIIDTLTENPSLVITMLGTQYHRRFQWRDFFDHLEKPSNSIKDKVGSYEFNTLLQLNLQLAYVNLPVYAGLDRFLAIARPNVRHFKELCYSALRAFDADTNQKIIGTVESMPTVSYFSMQKAALEVSAAQTKEVVNYPPNGRRLSIMMHRIGRILKEAQKTPYQSEPEQTIFVIEFETEGGDPDLDKILLEAVSWRIFTEDQSKRKKSEGKVGASREYFINPIYSAHFGLSYRKKRHITFPQQAFKTILSGTEEEYNRLLDRYQRRWKGEDQSSQGDLLS